MMCRIDLSAAQLNIDVGASKIFPTGSDTAAFDYRQAQEIRDVFAQHGVRHLFTGKPEAILLGFPDTTQDAHLFPQRSVENGRRLVSALQELGFALTEPQTGDIELVAIGAPRGRRR
jgi:hypothetical protein